MATLQRAHQLNSFGRIAASPPSPSKIHRHQKSLEAVLNFQQLTLSTSQRNLAVDLLTRILDACDSKSPAEDFDRVSLLKLSLEHNPSLDGRDNFLNFVLRHYLPADQSGCHDADNTVDWRFSVGFADVLEQLDTTVSSWRKTAPESAVNATVALADHFVYYFFLAMKGQAMRTPQPTPCLTPVGETPHTPTTNRLTNLRTDCLNRDSHRCMISQLFDLTTAQRRKQFVDDDGSPLTDEGVICTEVAHIIPHALGEPPSGDSSLPETKAIFWEVMRLFNPQVEQMLNGVDIDRPYNAMTLATDLHKTFGSLGWYLEEDNINPQPNTYIFKPAPSSRRLILNPIFLPSNPRRRITFTNATNNTVDLPDARLLALHRACAIILALSGAGEYIERLLEDDAAAGLGGREIDLQSGGVDLGAMITWRLALKGSAS